MKSIIRYALLSGILFSGTSSWAQIEFKDPFFTEKKNRFINLDKIVVKPRSIIFHMSYDGGSTWKSTRNAGFSHFLSLPYLGIRGSGEFPLTDGSDRKGVAAMSVDGLYAKGSSFKPIKSRTLYAEFPFNANMLLFQVYNMRYTNNNNTLLMDLLECSNRSTEQKWEPICINFLGIRLPFADRHLHLLQFHNFLGYELKKTEFETSAQHKSRTHPDSLLKAMLKKFTDLEEVLLYQAEQRIVKAKPTLNYDADSEKFTMTFPGTQTDPYVFRVPLDRAQSFKADFQNGTLKIYDLLLVRKSDNEYYVSKLTWQHNKNKTEAFDNLYGVNKYEEWRKNYLQGILKDLSKMLPEGKVWGELK